MVLGIYGAGGVGKEVKEIAEMTNTWSDLVFIDDTIPDGMLKNVRYMSFNSFTKEFSPDKVKVIVALGEPQYKIALYNKVKKQGYSFANIIHFHSTISSSAQLGTGIIVKAGVVISSDTTIGDNVCLEENSYIGHDSVVRTHSQISPSVAIAGHCQIGEGAYIGLNASIKQNTVIGDHSVVGMGSVVLHDIPDNVIAFGNPARVIRPRGDERVFKS